MQSLRAEVESTKAEIEKATRTGDYAKVSELQYGKLPTLQNSWKRKKKSPRRRRSRACCVTV